MKKYIWIGLSIVLIIVLTSIVYHFVLRKQAVVQANDKTTELATSVITYQVLNIAESNNENDCYLTLRKYQAEEVETVKVNKKLDKNIQNNKSYEFTFQYQIGTVEEGIKSIFQHAELISIVETEKKGMDQRQDSIQ